MNNSKNLVLFVEITQTAAKSIKIYQKSNEGKKFRFGVIYNSKKPMSVKKKKLLAQFDVAIGCDFNSRKSMTEALRPFYNELLAITSRSELRMQSFRQIIPHVPYLRTPTSESINWSIDKLEMRRRFSAYDKTITPKYVLVEDTKKKTMKKIEEKIGFPLVIKPSGLASSLLVNVVYHQEELETVLKRVLRKISRLNKEYKGKEKAQILVEQFMEGETYSVDAYVTSRGKLYFCPFVHVKTGRTIGFDDFFGYQQTTPTLLHKDSIKEAKRVSAKGVHALGLRSTTAHIELIKTEQGWKLIEIGPRAGGFRDALYRLAFGINHTANDIFIRIPRRPILPRKRKGYAAVLKFFAQKEGVITNLTGTQKAQNLESFQAIEMNKKIGERAVFAKHGGKSVFNIILFNKSRANLLADIRRLEQAVKIETL